MRLRTTCDNIYGVTGNSAYSNKLGKGRVNLYKAMTDTTSPGIRMNLVSITDNNDNVYVANDTLRMVIWFKNLLHPTSSAALATIAAQSTNVTLIGSNTFALGVMNTFDTISNYAVAFTYKIKPTAPINAVIPFKVTVTDGTYSDFLSYSIVVNVDYINVDVNDIGTTQTSKGRVGYTDINITTGLGFRYMGSASNLYEMGLMVYNPALHGDDCVRTQTAGGQNADFGYSQRVTQGSNPNSDFFAQGILNETGTTDSIPLGIGVTHNTYAWTTNPDRKYVIVQYIIKNNNASPLSNIRVGLYSDWDVVDVADTSGSGFNRDSVDVTRQMGIAWNVRADGYWCSVKLLNHNLGFNHYAIDNDGAAGAINAYTGFTRAAKYLGLSTSRDVAGWETPDGDDVSDVVGTGPLTIAAGDSVTVGFALLACENLGCLLSNADEAQIKYDSIFPTGIAEVANVANPTLSIYPNPASNSAIFTFSLSQSSHVELSIYNTLGEKVQVLENGKFSAGNYNSHFDLSNLESGSYYVHFNTADKSEIQQMVILR
jgi:hypothetical protein